MAKGDLPGIPHQEAEPHRDQAIDSHEDQDAKEILIPSPQPGKDPDDRSDEQNDVKVFLLHD